MESATDAFVLILFGGLTYKTVDVVRHARRGEWASIRYQALAWLMGVAVVFVLAGSELGTQIRLGTGFVYGMSTTSKVLLGTALASTMSIIHDLLSNRGSGTPRIEKANTSQR